MSLNLSEPLLVGSRDVNRYVKVLSDHLTHTMVTTAANETIDLAAAINKVIQAARHAHAVGRKLIFIGNGGSAAIASHMATDFSKNGAIRTLSLNDAAMLTCLANDLGYERVFAKQIELYAQSGDVLIAISSSGRSTNILNAVQAARAAHCSVITFSGFTTDNPLRKMGDINFYIASDRYGFVEIGHLTLCHAVLDFICGLFVPDEAVAATTTAA
jgi:D-sedoheptulose 7-phosphate isomerase